MHELRGRPDGSAYLDAHDDLSHRSNHTAHRHHRAARRHRRTVLIVPRKVLDTQSRAVEPNPREGCALAVAGEQRLGQRPAALRAADGHAQRVRKGVQVWVAGATGAASLGRAVNCDDHHARHITHDERRAISVETVRLRRAHLNLPQLDERKGFLGAPQLHRAADLAEHAERPEWHCIALGAYVQGRGSQRERVCLARGGHRARHLAAHRARRAHHHAVNEEPERHHKHGDWPAASVGALGDAIAERAATA